MHLSVGPAVLRGSMIKASTSYFVASISCRRTEAFTAYLNVDAAMTALVDNKAILGRAKKRICFVELNCIAFLSEQEDS